jgi:hypothetical protein
MSVARQFSGSRRAADAIDALHKIGIPVTLESLDAFAGKLRQAGLVEDGAAASSAPPNLTPFPTRLEWPEPVRGRYQSALKLLREDKPLAAKTELEEFAADPSAPREIAELRDAVERRMSAAPGSEPTFAQIFNSAEKSWFGSGETIKYGAVDESLPSADEFLPSIPRPRMGGAVVGAALFVALGAGALAIPFPRNAVADCQLTAGSELLVRAPRAGRIAEVMSLNRPWVEKGETVLTYDADEPKRIIEEARAAEREARVNLGKIESAPKLAAYRKLEAELARATAERSRLAKTKGPRAATAKANKRVASLEAALNRSLRPGALSPLPSNDGKGPRTMCASPSSSPPSPGTSSAPWRSQANRCPPGKHSGGFSILEGSSSPRG